MVNKAVISIDEGNADKILLPCAEAFNGKRGPPVTINSDAANRDIVRAHHRNNRIDVLVGNWVDDAVCRQRSGVRRFD